jgi:hypothetical protein
MDELGRRDSVASMNAISPTRLREQAAELRAAGEAVVLRVSPVPTVACVCRAELRAAAEAIERVARLVEGG